MTNREQAIKQVAELVSASPESVQKALIGEVRFMQQTAQTLINYAIYATEKLLAAEARVLELTGGLDAAIETARRDALEEAAKAMCEGCEDGYPFSPDRPNFHVMPEGIRVRCGSERIRALAAQKKEG